MTLFIGAAISLGFLWFIWNWQGVRILRALPSELRAVKVSALLGGFGFLATSTALVLFFVKTLREMRLNQQQNEFLSTVSHELKTPIAAIELAGSLLERSINKGSTVAAPPESPPWSEERSTQLELLAVIRAETTRLRDQVQSLLEAARLEDRGRSTVLTLERLDLRAFLEESWLRWKSLLGDGAVFLLQVQEGFEPWVRADRHSLQLIIDNLIDNARKFAVGAPHVVVRLDRPLSTPNAQAGQRARTFFCLSVIDQGAGFRAEERRLIFNKFYRATQRDRGTKTAVSGTGLGLSIAWLAAKSLRMKLTAQSAGPNQGAVFTLKGRILG